MGLSSLVPIASRYRFSGKSSAVTRFTVAVRTSAPWKMSACLYESEAGDCQTALVVSDVCVERNGAGRVKEQCERDKEPIGSELGHGLPNLLRSDFLSCVPVTLKSRP